MIALPTLSEVLLMAARRGLCRLGVHSPVDPVKWERSLYWACRCGVVKRGGSR